MDKPALRTGDIVQINLCPRESYHRESHTARVLSEPQLFEGRWSVVIKYKCYDYDEGHSAIVDCEDLMFVRHSRLKNLRSNMSENPWYMSRKFINFGVAVIVIIVTLMILGSMFGGVNNTYVNKSQQVSTAKSNISKEEQRRVDLFNNLVDAVESAKNFEKETQVKIAEARGQGNGGDINGAMVTIQAVTEAYPEIKSTELYKQTMLEFSATENRLAQYREQYNGDVRDYNAYVQGFPSGVFLSILGKDKSQKPYLDFNVDNKEARNLFN